MKKTYRDTTVSQHQYRERALLAWALATSASTLLLIALCAFAFLSRQTIIAPFQGEAFSVSGLSQSPSYLRQLALMVLQYRLSFNGHTTKGQFERLLALTTPEAQDALRDKLKHERALIDKRNLTSTFYAADRGIKVDAHHLVVQVPGFLQRTEQGVLLKPAHKTYQIHFARHGLSPLTVSAIQEIDDAN